MPIFLHHYSLYRSQQYVDVRYLPYGGHK
jgi:hypothetical protein